jgi:hypothetical protein
MRSWSATAELGNHSFGIGTGGHRSPPDLADHGAIPLFSGPRHDHLERHPKRDGPPLGRRERRFTPAHSEMK